MRKVNRVMRCSYILKKIALTFIVVILVASYFWIINVNATTDFNDINLYSYTNTYDYNYDGKTPNIERYNLESRNGNLVDDGNPLLTILTHGLGG